MQESDASPAAVLEVLGDPISRGVLVAAAERPVSADSLAAELDVALSTVYRRTNRLTSYGLLDAEYRIGENGSQYRVFETALERVVFEFDGAACSVDVTKQRGLVDRFESFWTEFESSSPDGSGDGAPVRDGADHGGPRGESS